MKPIGGTSRRKTMILCDACPYEAEYVLHMSDSISMDNMFYGCRQCTADTLNDWFWSDIYRDTTGWEVRRI